MENRHTSQPMNRPGSEFPWGGAHLALLDLESLLSLHAQLEVVVGVHATDAVLQQLGANSGAVFASDPAGRQTVVDVGLALRRVLAACQAADLGQFTIETLSWPVGRVVVRRGEIEDIEREDNHVAMLVRDYIASVLTGYVNALSGRRDIVCIERSEPKAREMYLELLPAPEAKGVPSIGFSPDPFIRHQLRLVDLLFDRMPMGIAVFDSQFVLQRCNPTWADFIGRYTRTPASGVKPGTPFSRLAPGAEQYIRTYFERALAGETIRRESMKTVSDGIESYWDIVLTPLIHNGRVAGVVYVSIDVTERASAFSLLEQRVEERTAELERRRQVAEGLRDILAVLNSDRPLDEILDFIVAQAAAHLNAGSVAVYRLDHDEQALYIQSERGLPEGYAPVMRIELGRGAVGRAALERRPVSFADITLQEPEFFADMTPEQREGMRILTQSFHGILAVPLIIKDEVYGGIVLYYRERREFARDEINLAVTFADQVALAIENARLREQAQLAAAVAERNRLARDLHDAVTQTLFSASLIAEVLPRLWEKDADEGRRRLGELRQLTRGALAEMRTLLLELRPAALVEASLPDLLRQLAEAMAGRGRVPVDLHVEGQERLAPEVQVAFYRIAQEALNNVAKHSGASKAEVCLQLEPGRAAMSIRDDGRGFDPGRVRPEHLGLGIMRERAENAGAALEVFSSPGLCTEIRVVWEKAGRKVVYG